VTRIVVSDTGSLLHLSVADEFEQNAQGWKPPQWVQIIELTKSSRQISLGWQRNKLIDAGESAAIALALQIQANWLLSDDAKARQFAQLQGLEVHGSIGLLLWSVACGYVNDRKQALVILDALAGSTLWVSDRVVREASQAIEKLLRE